MFCCLLTFDFLSLFLSFASAALRCFLAERRLLFLPPTFAGLGAVLLLVIVNAPAFALDFEDVVEVFFDERLDATDFGLVFACFDDGFWAGCLFFATASRTMSCLTFRA